MNSTIGIINVAGKRAAFDSAVIIRSSRSSRASIRRELTNGVPYFSVWIKVLTRASICLIPVRSQKF